MTTNSKPWMWPKSVQTKPIQFDVHEKSIRLPAALASRSECCRPATVTSIPACFMFLKGKVPDPTDMFRSLI